MTLKGWSLPLSPSGRASLVPPPPWHFSGDALGVNFVAPPGAIAQLLPRGMEPMGDGAISMVFCDWSSSAEDDPRFGADPAKGQYKEAYLSIPALLDGKRVARVPYIWVDSDLSLARGHIQGFPKKFGVIAITRAVAVGKGGSCLASGERFAAHVSAVGCRLAEACVTLESPAGEGFVPTALRLPVWHTRYFPDLAGGEPLVEDLARNIVSDFEVAQGWVGSATLSLGDSEFEDLGHLTPLEVTSGWRFSLAFTVTGAEVRTAP